MAKDGVIAVVPVQGRHVQIIRLALGTIVRVAEPAGFIEQEVMKDGGHVDVGVHWG